MSNKNNRTELKIDILRFGKGGKRKKKKDRHRAGGYYAPHIRGREENDFRNPTPTA